MRRILKWIAIFLGVVLAVGLVWKVVDPEGFARMQAEQEARRAETQRRKDAKAAAARADTDQAEARVQAEGDRSHPERRVSVEMQWSNNGINVMTARFTVKNENAFDVKDIEVRCELTAASGTVVGRPRQTILQVVPAHGTIRSEELNLGFIDQQARNATCSVYDADVA